MRVLERSQCRLELCCLHGDPEHVDRRHFGGARNRHIEVPERAFQMKLFRILRERFAPDHDRNGCAGLRQARADQTANSARSENRMS